jgi:hypothetical protein
MTKFIFLIIGIITSNQFNQKYFILIKSFWAISHVKCLKFSVFVPIIRVMIYLFPENPTFIHARARVQAKCKPMGASGRIQVLALLWPASGLVYLHTYIIILMMETEMVPKTENFNHLTWVMAWKDFIKVSCHNRSISYRNIPFIVLCTIYQYDRIQACTVSDELHLLTFGMPSCFLLILACCKISQLQPSGKIILSERTRRPEWSKPKEMQTVGL